MGRKFGENGDFGGGLRGRLDLVGRRQKRKLIEMAI